MNTVRDPVETFRWRATDAEPKAVHNRPYEHPQGLKPKELLPSSEDDYTVAPRSGSLRQADRASMSASVTALTIAAMISGIDSVGGIERLLASPASPTQNSARPSVLCALSHASRQAAVG